MRITDNVKAIPSAAACYIDSVACLQEAGAALWIASDSCENYYFRLLALEVITAEISNRLILFTRH
jgi:hypothetical protein